MGFLSPKPPPPPAPLPKVPTREDPSIASKREKDRLALAKRGSGGRKASVLTSPLGASDPQAGSVRRPALLGKV